MALFPCSPKPLGGPHISHEFYFKACLNSGELKSTWKQLFIKTEMKKVTHLLYPLLSFPSNNKYRHFFQELFLVSQFFINTIWDSNVEALPGVGGGYCSLVPLIKIGIFPCSPKSKSWFLCSLFPKIAFVPLFPSVLDFCSLVPLI